MRFDYGANPIFLNKKKKRLDIQNTCYTHPPSLHPITSHFGLTPPPLPLPHPPQSGRHMSITPSPVSLNRYIQVFCM